MANILCFISSLSGGGAERQMLELIKFLEGAGHDITLLTYAKGDDYTCPKGVKRVEINSRFKVVLFFKLLFFIRSQSFDCCISYLFQNNLIACLSTFPIKKIRLIVGERNLSINYGIKEMLLFYLYKRADYVVTNSLAQHSFILNHAAYLSPKLRTIHNFTDVEVFKPEKRNKLNKQIKVGIFARYTFQKNPLILVELVKKLIDSKIHCFEFHWFGNKNLNCNNLNEISSEYVQLSNLIKKEKLSDYIYLHPFSNEVHADINEMDIISLFSFYEGFPNSISEGLCSGKIIIASSVSDIPYIVKNGVNGFLFDPNDIDSIFKAFCSYLLLNEDEIQSMSMINRKKALSLFSKDMFKNKYLDLILCKH